MQAGRTTVCKICNHEVNYSYELPEVAESINRELDIAVTATEPPAPAPIEAAQVVDDETQTQPQTYATVVGKSKRAPWLSSGLPQPTTK
jgi:hypothetical protein